MNYWFEVLLAFRNGRFPEYYYGLTPRFIVGACQIPIGQKFESADQAYDATNQMYLDMKSFNSDSLIVTSVQCNLHNGPVMQLKEAELTDGAIGTSFDEIWARYGDEIISGSYNINETELKILKSIFG